MSRQFVGAAVSMIGVIALALLLGDSQDVRAYASVESLASDLGHHGLGCRRPEGRLLPGPPIVSGEAANCLIGSAVVTIHVIHDSSVMDSLDDPTPQSGVSWARGPNWLAATMDRIVAASVALALNADLVSPAEPAARGCTPPSRDRRHAAMRDQPGLRGVALDRHQTSRHAVQELTVTERLVLG